MAQQLSAKQYIQTRARTLPIYKCLVIKGWGKAKMAQVVVMRKHVNGNITAGVYLVDLLCLGIKDTVYFFNLPEAEMDEKFGNRLDLDFEEIDYNLAHNIIYAGHDFALEFDIKPHADFAVSKFILEEDNDDIELVDIEVGDDDGKPHLMVSQPGEFSGALAKLKKNAGEGNYYYTVGQLFNEEDEEEMGEGDDSLTGEGDDAQYNIEEFDRGEITPRQAMVITLEDLKDEQLVHTRTAYEVMNLETELWLRTLEEINPDYFYHDEDGDYPDRQFVENDRYASGLSEEQEQASKEAQAKLLDFYELEAAGENDDSFAPKRSTFLLGLLGQYGDNPLVVANIYEYALLVNDERLGAAARDGLGLLAQLYPLAELTLALGSLVKNEDAPQYAFIYNSQSLTAAFPGNADLSDADMNTYGLLQTVKNLNDGDMKLAVFYYYYAAHTGVFSWLLPFVQTKLMGVIKEVLEGYKGVAGVEETGEDDDTAYYNMDEFDLGEITPQQAMFIYTEDLMNEELVAERAPNEVLNINTEVALRTLEEIHPDYFFTGDKEGDPDKELLENEGYASGLSAEQEDAAVQSQQKLLEFYQQEAEGEDDAAFGERRNEFLLGLLHDYAGNPVVVANVFEYALFVQEKQVAGTAEDYLVQLCPQYPLALLTLALAALLKNEEAPQYAFIYNSENLVAAFPGKTDLSDADLNTYGLLKVLKNVRENNLRLAVYYYYYAAHTEVFSWLLPLIQSKFVDAIHEMVEEYKSESNDDDSDSDDNDNLPVLRAV